MLTSALIATCCARYRHVFRGSAIGKFGSQGQRILALILVVLVAVIVLGVSKWSRDGMHVNEQPRLEELQSERLPVKNEGVRENSPALGSSSVPPKKPIYNLEVIDQVQMYVSTPRNVEKGVKGILLAFHGCTRSGLDWFRLPEESIVVRHATEQRVAVVAFTAYSRSGCWSHTDSERVPQAFEKFTNMHEWARNVPLFAFGASSGGSFVIGLPTLISGIRGIMAQIARPPGGYVEKWKKPYPRSLHLLFMTKDNLRAEFDYFLQQEEVRNSGIRSTILESKACAVTSQRLMERVHEMTPQIADGVIRELVKRKILNETTLVPMVSNVYRLKESAVNKDMFLSVQEQVKVCYAQHELTAEYFPEVLQAWMTEG